LHDYLGSIREVTDSSGLLRAPYDYDPYAQQVVVTGNMKMDLAIPATTSTRRVGSS